MDLIPPAAFSLLANFSVHDAAYKRSGPPIDWVATNLNTAHSDFPTWRDRL